MRNKKTEGKVVETLVGGKAETIFLCCENKVARSVKNGGKTTVDFSKLQRNL